MIINLLKIIIINQKNILNDDNFKDVSFIYNNGIQYEYDKKNKKFNIYQTDFSGRSFFLKGKIKNISIHFIGKDKQYLNQIVKYDHNNLTGCISFIKSKFYNTSLSAIYANCEDGINMINASGSVQNIDVAFSVLDGVDLDFSDIFIKNIRIKDSGNDCIDFSGGKYRITSFDLSNCGDKGISIGEKSIIDVENIKINKATIGIASKDSSQAFIDMIRINDTSDCLAAYRKKQEFDGGFLNVKNSDCKDFKRVFFVDQFSKINIENEM